MSIFLFFLSLFFLFSFFFFILTFFFYLYKIRGEDLTKGIKIKRKKNREKKKNRKVKKEIKYTGSKSILKIFDLLILGFLSSFKVR